MRRVILFLARNPRTVACICTRASASFLFACTESLIDITLLLPTQGVSLTDLLFFVAIQRVRLIDLLFLFAYTDSLIDRSFVSLRLHRGFDWSIFCFSFPILHRGFDPCFKGFDWSFVSHFLNSGIGLLIYRFSLPIHRVWLINISFLFAYTGVWLIDLSVLSAYTKGLIDRPLSFLFVL